ncbi:PREDICTED: putative F-box protein At4g22170 [Ipomoea nil]|uniref:putative F-box protein At4g22170 n=1 Tax=Ipomoea nil TaxID=35883 RepID=UPI000901883A|nr:PREDICTED: putative F-box protein At4g22170 [Ipomoea nil]
MEKNSGNLNDGSKENPAASTILADCSNLGFDPLGIIAHRLNFALDYVRFGMVCRSWSRVVAENGPSFLPWLMLSQKHDTDFRGVCYPFENRSLDLHLPELHDKRCWGSPCGWVVTLGSDFGLGLLNPLTRAQRVLPPLPNLKNLVCSRRQFRNSFVNKVVLSSSPDFVVLAIYSKREKMAILKAGNHTWTPLPLECCPRGVEDAICFDGKVYIVGCSWEIAIFDCQGCVLQEIIFPPLQEVFLEHQEDLHPDDGLVDAYVVEINGLIYVVCKVLETRNDQFAAFHLRTKRFDVYRLELQGNEGKSDDVESLGDWSIFVGNNHSFSICCTNKYPDCVSNCIYFTDDRSDFLHSSTSYDIGVYNLQTRKIQWVAQDDFSVFSYSAPLWFNPSLS